MVKMKNEELLVYGGIALVGVVIAIMHFAPTMFEDIKYGVGRIFNPDIPLPPGVAKMSPQEEEDTAAMYAGYY